MSKHTPGPWTIKVDPARNVGDWRDDGGYRIDAPGVEQLAYVWNASKRFLPDSGQANGPEFGSDAGEANARLIAAAPELLEALQYVMSAHGEQLDDAFGQARAAIAKATQP